MNYPEKHFYTIGEISEITKIKPHILRYWESQLKVLRPARRYSGHRKYTQREVDLVNRIRTLVIDRKFTLSGARRELQRQLNPRPSHSPEGKTLHSASSVSIPALQEIKKEVEDCLNILQPKKEEKEGLLIGA